MSTDNTLFVQGVPEGVTQSQLQATITGAAKEVSKVNLNERKRYAHVVFESHEAAEKGLKVLKKTPISGSVLEVEWSKPKEAAAEFDEASNKTVFIQNVSTSTESEEIQTAFAEYGEIERAFVVTDKKSKTHKGQAVVEFKDRESAEKALELNDTELGGQTITVEFAKAPRSKSSSRAGNTKPQTNGSASKPGQKRKANDDEEDKPAKKAKATKETPKKSDAAATKKETPKKEAAAAPKKETPKKADAAAAPKKETPKKEAAAAATPSKKETPKKAATPSKAKGKK